MCVLPRRREPAISELAAAVVGLGALLKLQGSLLPTASPVVDPVLPSCSVEAAGAHACPGERPCDWPSCPSHSRSPPGGGSEPGRGTVLGLRWVVVQLPGVGTVQRSACEPDVCSPCPGGLLTSLCPPGRCPLAGAGCPDCSAGFAIGRAGAGWTRGSRWRGVTLPGSVTSPGRRTCVAGAPWEGPSPGRAARCGSG